ncbi:sugar phosphate isomerase/epimerase family protein [Paenibacillus humicola]|uniref:sugar phosphate isomerase/epimerase family protein n=1 Tax=Paenibacillus humicola TaxID=3110540 RepID=UPI00237B7506|nr:sugar phosphate isomerase/epimerase [Paenibacillus humicola]
MSETMANRSGKIKLAFSKPTKSPEEQTELFGSYRSFGYEGLQLKYNQFMPYLEEPERFMEQWGHLEGAGSGLILGGKLDEEGRAVLRRLFAFAKGIGTERIVFCHLVAREGLTGEDIAGYARILSRLGKEAREQGLRLSLHHHYDQPVMHREDFDIFFGHVEEESVGLTVDTAHLVKSGISDIAEIIRSFRHVIDNFHLKDYANGDWMVLGRGGIPFDPVFRSIREIGYSGWISADEESGGGIAEGLKDCYAFITNGSLIRP